MDTEKRTSIDDEIDLIVERFKKSKIEKVSVKLPRKIIRKMFEEIQLKVDSGYTYKDIAEQLNTECESLSKKVRFSENSVKYHYYKVVKERAEAEEAKAKAAAEEEKAAKAKAAKAKADKAKADAAAKAAKEKADANQPPFVEGSGVGADVGGQFDEAVGADVGGQFDEAVGGGV